MRKWFFVSIWIIYSIEVFPQNIFGVDFLKSEDSVVQKDGTMYFGSDVFTGITFYNLRYHENKTNNIRSVKEYLNYENGLLVEIEDKNNDFIDQINESVRNINEDKDFLKIEGQLYTGILKFRNSVFGTLSDDKDEDEIYTFKHGVLIAKQEVHYDVSYPYIRNTIKRIYDWDLRNKRINVKYFNKMEGGGLEQERVYSYGYKRQFSRSIFEDGVIVHKTYYDESGSELKFKHYDSEGVLIEPDLYEGYSFINTSSYDIYGNKQKKTIYSCESDPSFSGIIKEKYGSDAEKIKYEIKCLNGIKENIIQFFFNGEMSYQRHVKEKEGILFKYWEGIKRNYYTNGNLKDEIVFEVNSDFTLFRLDFYGSSDFLSWDKVDRTKSSKSYYQTGELMSVYDGSDYRYYNKKGELIQLGDLEKLIK